MKKRMFTLPVALIFIVLSPAFADRYQPDINSGGFEFEVRDGVCDGVLHEEYYFNFNDTPSSINVVGSATYNDYMVNSSYNPNINDTAYHLIASGDEGNGIRILYDMTTLGQNKTVSFDITNVKMDFYNVTLENMRWTDMHISQILHSEDKYVEVILRPNLELDENISSEHIEVDYRRNVWRGSVYECWLKWNNDTEISYYENCPYNITKISWFTLHMPYDGNQIVNGTWNVDVVMDNLIVKHEESSAISKDCAIHYENMNDISKYRHYATFNAIPIFSEAFYEEVKLYTAITCDYVIGAGMFIDETSDFGVFLRPNFNDTLVSKNISYEDLYTKEINMTCYFLPAEWQYPPYFDCTDVYIHGFSEINKAEYRDRVIRIDNYDFISDGLSIDRLDTFSIDSKRWRYKVNDSYWAEKNLETGVIDYIAKDYYESALGLNPIDECWDYFDNFSHYRYLINSDEWIRSDNTKVYSLNRNYDLESAEEDNTSIMLSGHGWAGNFQGFDYYKRMDTIDTSGILSSISYIGDGECSWLESGTTLWNLDNACIEEEELRDTDEGVTGGAVAPVEFNVIVAISDFIRFIFSSIANLFQIGG